MKQCLDGSKRHEHCEEIGGVVVCHDCRTVLGRKCEVYSRVVGYLRPVDMWNKGKKEEFSMRKEYKVGT